MLCRVYREGGLHWHLELAVVPLEILARGGRLVLAQRRAVHVVGVGFVGGAISDQGGHLQATDPV